MHYNIQRPLAEMKEALSSHRMGSPRTRSNYYFVITLTIKDLYYLKIFFDSCRLITLDHVNFLIQHWKNKQLSIVTIGSRLSILRNYLSLINCKINLPSNAELGLSRKNQEKSKNHSINADQLLKTIQHPINQIIIKFQLLFGLTKEEAIHFRIQRYNEIEPLVFVAKKVASNNRDRLIPVYSPEQEDVLLQLSSELDLTLSLAEKYSKVNLISLYHSEFALYGFSSKEPLRSIYTKNRLNYLLQQKNLSKKDALLQLSRETGVRLKTIREWIAHE